MDRGGTDKISGTRRLADYGLAIAAVGLAMLLRLPFSEHLGLRLVYVTFSPAVMLAATVGGLGPGLLATATAALLVAFGILQPQGQLLPMSVSDAVGLALFSGTGVFMSVAAGLYRQSRRRMAVYEKLLVRQESEDRFRAFFEKAAVGAAQVDLTGRFTQVNDCYCRITGYSREELLQMTPYEITHPEDREADRQQHRQFQAGRIPEYAAEKRYVRKDGNVIWVHVTAGLVRDAGGRPLGTAGIIEDITERRRTEEALRESEHEFRAFFDNAAVGAGQLDITGRFVRVNDRLCQLTGYSREELLRMTPVDITHPDDRRSEFEGSQALLRGEAPVHELEKRYVRKDGQVIWVQVSVGLAKNAKGMPLRTVGVIQDITARKQADAQLRTLAAVVENSGDFIGLSTPGMEPFFLNEAGRRMVGLDQAEVSRTPLLDYYWPEDRPLIKEAIPVLRREGRWSGEVRLRNFQTGDPIHTMWNMFAIKDGAGQLIAWAAVSPDISSRKRMEEDLRSAKEAAEEASRAKSEFLANMSHEIRTPMTVFMAAIEFLLQTEVDENRRQLLLMADNSAAQLRALIEDILDLAKVEARRLELHEEPFDLLACVRNALEMSSIPAREKNLRLEMTVGAGVPQIALGDRNRLGQILVNLVSNAVKFTEKGEVIVSVETRDGALRFAVSDTGIGIPEEKQHLLFQNFSQVDTSHTRKVGGAGLGLAICKGLVDLMGGKIEMHSRQGGGSVFSFDLPLKGTKGQECETTAEPGEGSSAEPVETCILLAEDDPTVQDMIRMLLAGRGCRVQTAANGREAVEKWQAGRYDLILMDVQMPEMDGLEATRNIRRLEREHGGHTRIIGITAHARREIREECLRAGMDDFLAKPLRLGELLARIDLSLAD